jgi:hypothetical protein
MKPTKHKKKRRVSGIPTGNAGEYFVMGELLRRGFDAQLADRNTQGYDMLVGSVGKSMRRVQVKSVRSHPWYASRPSFEGDGLKRVTVYVLLGRIGGDKPVRYFHREKQRCAEVLLSAREMGHERLHAHESGQEI